MNKCSKNQDSIYPILWAHHALTKKSIYTFQQRSQLFLDPVSVHFRTKTSECLTSIVSFIWPTHELNSLAAWKISYIHIPIMFSVWWKRCSTMRLLAHVANSDKISKSNKRSRQINNPDLTSEDFTTTNCFLISLQ